MVAGSGPPAGAGAGAELGTVQPVSPLNGVTPPVDGWVVEGIGPALPVAGPRWRADGGPGGGPCVEVTESEGAYVIARATPVPVAPGRRYVVSAWGYARGHFARYGRRAPPDAAVADVGARRRP